MRYDDDPLGPPPYDEAAMDPALPIDDLVARVRARVRAEDDDHEDAERGWLRSVRSLRGQSVRLRHWAALVLLVGLTAGALAIVQYGAGNTSNAERPNSVASGKGSGARTATPSSSLVDRRPSTSAVVTPATTPATSNSIVPPAWRSRCREAGELAANGGWVCSIAPELVVEVRRAQRGAASASVEALAASYRGRRAECVQASGVAGWARDGGTAQLGVFSCGQSARGAEVAWSVDRLDVVVRAIRADGDLDAVFAWWNALGARDRPL